MNAAGAASDAQPFAPSQGSRLTASGCALPKKVAVDSTQCVGTSPPAGLRNCSVAQPRNLHGRAPRFQIASDTAKLPAAPPLSAGQYAISKCEPVQIGSSAVAIGAVGDGVYGAVGEALGCALGAIDGAGGDGMLRGEADGVWTEGVPVHDASAAVSTAARAARWPGTRPDGVPVNERWCGLRIVDVVTRNVRPGFQPGLTGLSM